MDKPMRSNSIWLFAAGSNGAVCVSSAVAASKYYWTEGTTSAFQGSLTVAVLAAIAGFCALMAARRPDTTCCTCKSSASQPNPNNKE